MRKFGGLYASGLLVNIHPGLIVISGLMVMMLFWTVGSHLYTGN